MFAVLSAVLGFRTRTERLHNPLGVWHGNGFELVIGGNESMLLQPYQTDFGESYITVFNHNGPIDIVRCVDG